jgi:hypothetical protein
MKRWREWFRYITTAAGIILSPLLAGTFSGFTPVDQTPTRPLSHPTPTDFQPRYISGFGKDGNFTLFFEDRDNGSRIGFVTTQNGPHHFESNITDTNISDTHFLIKPWPIEINGTTYAYRAWASVGNNEEHHFYVAHTLSEWSLVSTFTIPNSSSLGDGYGTVFYGFHDVILLNGTYYAFAETNTGHTLIAKSSAGDDQWEAFAHMGGPNGQGQLGSPTGGGWTVRGNFFDLGNDRGMGKLYIHPDDTGFYLAVNVAAKSSLPPDERETAFIDPSNWTWSDGTTGAPPSTPIFSATSEHDLREGWVVPRSDPSRRWVLMYDADYGSDDGGKALGYANIYPDPCDGITKRLTAMHWTLISFPCETGNNGIGDLLGDALGSYETDWVMYEQSGTDDYIGHPSTAKRKLDVNDTVIPGRGYWIITATDRNMSIDTTLSGLAHTPMQAAATFDINDSAFDELNLTRLPVSDPNDPKKIMLGNPFQHKIELSEIYFSHPGTGGYHPMSSDPASPNADYIHSTVYTYDHPGTSAANYVAVTPDVPGFSDTLELGTGFFIQLKSGSSGENNLTYPFEK